MQTMPGSGVALIEVEAELMTAAIPIVHAADSLTIVLYSLPSQPPGPMRQQMTPQSANPQSFSSSSEDRLLGKRDPGANFLPIEDRANFWPRS